MRYLHALISYFSSSSILAGASDDGCKCTPDNSCWPSEAEWYNLNSTLSGRLIRSIPPASVCYPSQPNYNQEQCGIVRSQWFNSTWHAENPISIDYPIWANNSCNPIDSNGTSITGDTNAGRKGCSIGNYPVYVVNATTAEHVSKALVWAGKRNIRVVIKSTGHSFPGRSTGYASLSIWTHNFRGISHIPSFHPTSCPTIDGTLEAVRIAAGHTGIEAQSYLAKINRIVVTGGNPDVGLVGWITAGGHGPLSSTYGMGADNLLEATIVTPDGKVHVTNPCQNSDLFFAIRGGGGGTFGVVTEVVVKAFQSPKTTMHTFAVAALSPNTTTEYWDLIGYIHAEMPRLKAGGLQGYYFIVGPPTYPTLAFLWSFFLYDKPNGTLERLMAPIDAKLKEQAGLFAWQNNVTNADNYWDAWGTKYASESVANGGAAYGSRLLSAESLADPKKTARVFESIGPSPHGKNGPYANPTLLGHMIAHPNETTYYPNFISMNPAWRRTLTHFLAVETWRDGINRSAIDVVYNDITYNKTEQLRKLAPDTGAYFNEADSFEPDWQQSFFGKHYKRLREIKIKYDPKTVLWCRRCVGSEVLVEQENGRLCTAKGYKRRSHPHNGKRGFITVDSADAGQEGQDWSKRKNSDRTAQLEPHDGKRGFITVDSADVGQEGQDWSKRKTSDLKARLEPHDGKRGFITVDSVDADDTEHDVLTRKSRQLKRVDSDQPTDRNSCLTCAKRGDADWTRGGPYDTHGNDIVDPTRDKRDMKRSNPPETAADSPDKEHDWAKRNNVESKRGGPYETQHSSSGENGDDEWLKRNDLFEPRDHDRTKRQTENGPHQRSEKLVELTEGTWKGQNRPRESEQTPGFDARTSSCRRDQEEDSGWGADYPTGKREKRGNRCRKDTKESGWNYKIAKDETEDSKGGKKREESEHFWWKRVVDANVIGEVGNTGHSATEDMERANRRVARSTSEDGIDEETDSVRITGGDEDDMQRANRRDAQGSVFKTFGESGTCITCLKVRDTERFDRRDTVEDATDSDSVSTMNQTPAIDKRVNEATDLDSDSDSDSVSTTNQTPAFDTRGDKESDLAPLRGPKDCAGCAKQAK